jgi:hypothetical protein
MQITACSSDHSGSHEATSTGTLRLPLVTQASGHTYRLAANIEIYGPTYTTLYTGDSTETVLTTSLQTGAYTAYLSNWILEAQDSSGNFQPVTANLTSSYYVSFTIFNQSSTSISFLFETDGVVVPFGEGQLNVKLGVTETTPACTMLGTDCPSGTWCAPPGLTGSPLACIQSGWLGLGEACSAPTDCAANSTCIDFGAGSVCAGVCPPSQFGQACANGTCTQSSADYGVCVPAGASIPDAGAGGFGGAGGTGPGTGGFGSGGFSAAGGKPVFSTSGGSSSFRT